MKSIKIYASIFVLLFGIHNTHAMNDDQLLPQNSLTHQLLGYIGQSKAICAIQKGWGDGMRAIPNFSLNNKKIAPPADTKWQKLFTEAQNTVGISPEKHVPLFKTKSFNSLVAFPMPPLPSGVYISTQPFAALSYGEQRSLLFREAVQVKYNDFTMACIIPMLSFITTTAGSKIILNKAIQSLAARTGTSFAMWPKRLVTWTLSAYIGQKYASVHMNDFANFAKRRASTEGLYATQCSECVDLVSIFDSHPLTRAELQSIATALRAEHKLCDYHKEQKD